jgi:hypothetical protein
VYAEQWNIEGLSEKAKDTIAMEILFADWAAEEGIANEEIASCLSGPSILGQAVRSCTYLRLVSECGEAILNHDRKVPGQYRSKNAPLSDLLT